MSLLFFFSLLGAFNGWLLALYFIFLHKGKRMPNILLGFLLIVLSIRVTKSVFFYFNSELSDIYIHIGLLACSLIGPFLYLYTSTSILNKTNFKLNYLLHFVPFLGICIVAINYPYWEHRSLWRFVVKLIYWQWLIYIIISGYYIRDIYKSYKKQKKLGLDKALVSNVFIGTFIIWLAFFTSSYTSYIVGAVSFSFMLYITFILFLFKAKQGRIKSKKATNTINSFDEIQITDDLKKLLAINNTFKNPNLKMPDVANELRLTPHEFSRYLNDNLKTNFAQFINEYRINEAEQLLLNDNKLSIEGIAFECGFNSVSTFYTAFKKRHNITPTKYREENS